MCGHLVSQSSSAWWPDHHTLSLRVAIAATSRAGLRSTMPGPSPSTASAAAAGHFGERFEAALSEIRGHYEMAISQGDGQTAADLVGAVEALSANFKPKPLMAPVATSAATSTTPPPTATSAATSTAPPTASSGGTAARRSTSRHNKKVKEDVF